MPLSLALLMMMHLWNLARDYCLYRVPLLFVWFMEVVFVSSSNEEDRDGEEKKLKLRHHGGCLQLGIVDDIDFLSS